jgi:L-aspartate oxidase
VARSIVYEMKKTGSDRVFIDVTHLPPYVITTRFPHIYRFCLDHGLDITKGLIPVAPAAHYMMGGIKANSWGETNIAGLFAIGETACTGVHGANRLASNSLLEAVVFSKRIIERTVTEIPSPAQGKEAHYSLIQRQALETISPPSHSALQQLLWDKVGIIRNKESLTETADVLATWQKSLPQPTDRPSYELNNLVMTGRLITEAALLREESRGAHFRSDFPRSSPQWQRHIVLAK